MHMESYVTANLRFEYESEPIICNFLITEISSHEENVVITEVIFLYFFKVLVWKRLRSTHKSVRVSA